MEFLVLGTVEVVVDGRTLPLGGTRERAVLARLLLSANQVVTRDALVAQLWPGDGPESGGVSALQAYVYRLRQVLRRAGAEDVVRTRSPGYLLAVDPLAVDAARFEARVREAVRSAEAGNPAAAAAQFAEALALWQGPPYQGIGGLPFAEAEAARLEEARLGALEARLEADLACGRDRELIGELAALTADHPLRERFWAARMTALYRAGRQADALRVYQELRRILAEDLGLEPSAELRALEGAILRQNVPPARQPTREPITPAAAVPPPMEQHRPQPPPDASGPGVVTFMFTDLVGSTELLDRLGDDAADEVRRAHFAVLRTALQAHGGTEVKNLGDGLMTAFTSPAAAVRCAVKIQQDASARDPVHGRLPGIRVGIHAGEPIAEDDDFFGTPVVIAQRLCARAEGGQILVSTLVQALAGNRAGCSFTPLGGLLLKGLAVPVEACEVGWVAPEPQPALPLPAGLAPHDGLFVRPEADMARLEAAWTASRSGRRQVVLLAGEPGIGKTRRSAEIARTAHAAHATVLHGRCSEGLNVPYQPFVEALGIYLRRATDPTPGRLGAELTRLVPEVRARFPDLADPLSADPETERYRLFDAVAAWLAAVAEAAPTVLVIEDVHWATAPTLGMLCHLARSGEPGRFMLVVNYRDTALDLTPALSDAVADLLRQPDVDRLRLTGLDRDGVAAYLTARGGGEVDQQSRRIVERLHAETAGNPFFLGELLRHLGETGALTDGKWADGGGIPETVRDVIARRVAGLAEETREILALAAVQGDSFDPSVLAQATGRPYVDVLSASDAAVAARLVTHFDAVPPEYRFVHALVRHTIIDGLGMARRMQLHRATAEALTTIAGEHWQEHAAELARHWLAATAPVGSSPAETRRTLGYAEAAATRAAAALAYEEAVDLLTRALPLARRLDEPLRHAQLLVALGEAQHHAADAAHRDTLREATALALDLGDGPLAARAALANQRPVNVLAAVDPERVALLEAVLVALGPAAIGARARTLAALGTDLHHTTDPRRHSLVREALTVARETDDPLCLARVLAVAGFALWQPDTLAERLAIAAELNALAEPLGDPVVQIDAGLALYYAAAEAGDFDRARAGLSNATRLADELGQPALRLRVLWARQNCAMLDGRFADFKRFSAQAMQLGEALGNPEAHAIRHVDGAVGCLLLGHLAEATEGLELGQARLRLPAYVADPVRAWVEAESGRPSAARQLLAELGCPALDRFPNSYVRLIVLTCLAGACVAMADRGLAEALYPELLPYSEHFALAQVSALGPVAHYLGGLAALLGRATDADRHFTHAAALAERTGARGMLVRTQLDWARLLMTRGGRGDAAEAQRLLVTAQDLAQQLDAPALAARAFGPLTPAGL